MGNEKLYYYTDYNTFKLILKNGTLRFKESTGSNDKLDSIQLFNELSIMIDEKLDDSRLKAEQKFYFDMMKNNKIKSTRISLVACFTSKKDSRLLWDAYTMHRMGRESNRYNGVCIEFDKENLLKAMKNANGIFDIMECRKITYGFDKIKSILENVISDYSKEVEKLSKDKNQDQDIIPAIEISNVYLKLKKCIVYPILKLIDKFDLEAPFIKHEFWREESEVRALLSMKDNEKNIKKIQRNIEENYYYFDISINSNSIRNVILGPEFSNDEEKELNSIKGVIPFARLNKEKSIGTGVIVNR